MFSEFRKQVAQLAGDYSQYIEQSKEPEVDLALPCFALARKYQKSPQEFAVMIAAELSAKKRGSLIKEVRATGPYVNFYIDFAEFSERLLRAVDDDYGSSRADEKILIESPGPNTNKPLHLGHVRNLLLGTSLSNILSFCGFKTINVDIVNDRGIHICKSMLAYRKMGGGEPDKKPDHFVGDYYVLFAKSLEQLPETESELRQMLVDWENGDHDVMALWKKMNGWALAGFQDTYARLGAHIDKTYYESEHYREGKQIVMDGLAKGIFQEEEGNIIVDLGALGKRVLLRKDGTSVYLTQDIALAKKRFHDYKMDSMIYVVASEQIEHFKALFEIFKLLNYPFAHSCYHLAYGMVNLPEGKMKSREGTVVDADDLMDELHELARAEVLKRDESVAADELEERAERIAMGALKFFMLKFDAMKTFVYDPKTSLSFEGDTGPYVMYTYARCRSIERKAEKHAHVGPLGSEERKIVRKVSLFPDVVQNACRNYNPQSVAMYALELSALFNEYYHATKIIGSDKEDERLALVRAVAIVLRRCLSLLGIEPLERM